MRRLKLTLTVVIFCLLTNNLYSQLLLKWPISNSFDENADVVTSTFGPRFLSHSTPFDIHYGIDLNQPNGGEGNQIYSPVNIRIEEIDYTFSDGNYIELSYLDTQDFQYKRLRFFHLEEDPRDPPYELRVGDTFARGEAIPGVFVGATGLNGGAAHLHIAFFPLDQDNLDAVTQSENPMLVFPYNYQGNPYSVSDPHLEKDGENIWFSFTAFIPPRRLDLNRVELSFNSFEKNGFIYTHNNDEDSFIAPIIDSEYIFANNIQQEIGVIDFQQRIGLNVQSDNNDTFNGVKIEPEELQNTSFGGYQFNTHNYKISFKLDNEVLKNTLVGGLYNIEIKLIGVYL